MKSEEFHTYGKTLRLSLAELEFLDSLPKEFRALARKRKQVAHGLGSPMLTCEQVAPLYKKFLGLGEDGILPRLALIKARLDKRV